VEYTTQPFIYILPMALISLLVLNNIQEINYEKIYISDEDLIENNDATGYSSVDEKSEISR